MIKVEFHILSETGEIARLRHVCQLVDQQYSNQQRVFVRTSDSAEAQRLDDMLWTFRDQAFIPHEIATPSSPTHPRIMALIGVDNDSNSFATTLINAGNSIPDNLETVSQLFEVVGADPQHKQLARDRYKQYRDRGYQLETKNL
jgi:DNA polymerase-3 subunit chi